MKDKFSLAIDTSTNSCGVALLNQNKEELYFRYDKGRSIHSERLFQFVQELLIEAEVSLSDIQQVYTTIGPGSYTGLRIGASAIKGLLFGLDTELKGIETLKFLAKNAERVLENRDFRIHAVIDARRTHLYHQIFSINQNEVFVINELEIRDINDIQDQLEENDVLVGTGINRLDENIIKQKKGVIIEEKEAFNPIGLFQDDLNPKWNAFYNILNPASFEPNYYTRGYAQVQKQQ